ncbi:GDP-fucose transporter 1-like isoform X2 [Schistocerca gregaria]|uniref:GDP-fucose transporter 1-like isoform X2 n=1 Tax=Schistocerca gregaria TaxID=7010 RepID=UPI00211F0C56|nr:GDP-fucose transporter 1-like isoform X2 [Schistocerca gregaria]
MKDQNTAYERIKIAQVIGYYFAVSLSMIYFNKLALMKSFPCPITLTFFQFVASLLLCFLGNIAGNHLPALSFLPPVHLEIKTLKKVAPLTVSYVATIVFNNMCLQYAKLPFYLIARSLTIFWTVLFEKLILNKNTTKKRLIAVFLLFCGFILGSLGEIDFSLSGFVHGMLSSMFLALYGIYVKKTLAYVDNDQWKLLIYNTSIAIAFTFPLIFIYESNYLKPAVLNATQQAWGVLAMSCILGWLINIAVFMQIKYTSALTNSVCGTAKAGIQILLGAICFGETTSLLNFVGIVIILGSSFWYGVVTSEENAKQKKLNQADV